MTLPVLLDDNSYIETTLKKFNINDHNIAELAVKYSTLEIKDVDDKAGYAAVSTARKDVKSLRVAVEKKRKEIGEIPLKITREINKEAARLTTLIQAIEDPLETKEKAYEAEKQRIEQEKIRAAEEKLRGRINRLIELGFTYDGKNYISVPGNFDSQVTAEIETLKTINDYSFNGFIGLLKEAKEKKQAEIAEANRKQQEESEKAERDRKELADKLAEAQAKIDQMEQEKRENIVIEKLEPAPKPIIRNILVSSTPVAPPDPAPVSPPKSSGEFTTSVDTEGKYNYASLEIRYNILVERIKKYLKPATAKALLEGLE